MTPADEFAGLEQRGFGRRVGFGRSPALLVVDFLQAFTDPASALGAAVDNEISAVNRLLDLAHEASVPVFFSSISYNEVDLGDAGVWLRKIGGLAALRANTPEVAQDPRLHVNAGDALIVKKYASCFFGTDLQSRLQFRRIDTLVVAGCSTSGCVRATVVDACQLGLHAIVAREAVADRSGRAHRQSLIDIEMKYGDVRSVAQIAAYFAQGSQRIPE